MKQTKKTKVTDNTASKNNADATVNDSDDHLSIDDNDDDNNVYVNLAFKKKI